MPWLQLQPFAKAAGTVPLSCCCPAAMCGVQQAWASREGRGEGLAGAGGTWAERSPDREGAEVDGAVEGKSLWQP